MAITEADIAAAGARVYTDADALALIYEGQKTQNATAIALLKQDLAAAQAAADRAEAAANSVGAGSNGTVVAKEGENFTVPDGTIVRFGDGADWVEKVFDGNPHVCNLPNFGTTVDPAPNRVKQCVIGHYTP